MPGLITPSTIIGFWKEAGPDKWYKKDPQFDHIFREYGRAAHFAAARRQLDDWMDKAEGALALMIVLDQYPRNSFRGTAHQFATDPLARLFARDAIARGYLTAFEPDMRQFLLMPLMHSEDLADQDDLLPLCADMPETLKFAHIHRDIIVRFGRFPHRNEALGRQTTVEEQAFLDGGGFGG
ncbi:DUF924 family protein [Brevundimonas vitis]|uniref:DUF924 family protein n=1 Tax=Brevundimonas vitisensis TaxID=2800818 RepID=A0ABX7BRC0_9CAUL|nr:DUF924 family protein [Brevundimonas vitisensis]QQQ19263.1 DUF924 family protein [Brevundimonas vitisensis]